MSQVFHKSCFMTRSAGYKYRTHSTNTGDCKKLRENVESNSFEQKLRMLIRDISNRVTNYLESAQDDRERLQEKITSVEDKIDDLVLLHKNIVDMREDLTQARTKLAKLSEKVEKIESAFSEAESLSLVSLRPESSSYFKRT